MSKSSALRHCAGAIVPNKVEALILSLAPKRLADRLIANRLGLKPSPRA